MMYTLPCEVPCSEQWARIWSAAQLHQGMLHGLLAFAVGALLGSLFCGLLQQGLQHCAHWCCRRQEVPCSSHFATVLVLLVSC